MQMNLSIGRSAGGCVKWRKRRRAQHTMISAIDDPNSEPPSLPAFLPQHVRLRRSALTRTRSLNDQHHRSAPI